MRMRDLADAYLKYGPLDDAMAWAEKAIERRAAIARISTASTPRSSGPTSTPRSANDEAALADLRTAMTTIEAVRSRLVPADFFKQQFHLAQEESVTAATIALQTPPPAGRRRPRDGGAWRGRARSSICWPAAICPPRQDRAAAEAAVSVPPTSARDGLPLVFRGGRAGASRDGRVGDRRRSVSATPSVRPRPSQELVATAAAFARRSSRIG